VISVFGFTSKTLSILLEIIWQILKKYGAAFISCKYKINILTLQLQIDAKGKFYMTGATSEAGTAYPSETHELSPRF
jgi:hypothetical protein